MTKIRKRLRFPIALLCLTGLTIGILLVCFDLPYSLRYTVSDSTTKPNCLEISLEIKNSVFSKRKTVSLYTGDKTIDLKSCVDKGEGSVPVRRGENSIDVSLRRGETAILSYDASVGSLGKHGLRGNVTDHYCVFDGGEAFLLPEEFYEENFPENRTVIRELSIKMKVKDGWIPASPDTYLKNVTWADAYDLNNDSFCMGRFIPHSISVQSGTLDVYTLPENEEAFTGLVRSGVLKLFQYYGALFSYSKPNYHIVLLPPSGDTEASVIGGAGTGSVCSSFDANSQRDWELLSHRMFHAYFDSIFRTREFHASPQLWFYEGLATYYENVSMRVLPEEIQASFETRPTQLFTSLYNKYLYVRLHDPALFSLAPMLEREITQSESGKTRIEFLHYTQAPLVIRLLEELGDKQGRQADFLLKYLLEHKNESSLCDFPKLLPRLLGKEGEGIYRDYFCSSRILPLWFLKDPAYSQERTLSDLNDVEYELASWIDGPPEGFPLETINLDTVRKIRNLKEFQSAHFADESTEESVRHYSTEIDSLLREYALRAEICRVPPDAFDLRSRLFLDKENRDEWNRWIERHSAEKD